MTSRAVFLLAVAWAGAATGGEDAITLKDGEGRALVEARCVMCHSLDYIEMNSPIFDRKGWEASVNKMIKVMGAPVSPEEAQTIVDYLSSRYGK